MLKNTFKKIKTLFLIPLALNLSACSWIGSIQLPNIRNVYISKNNPIAIVTGHRLATAAANSILEQGGTAADAFAAALMTLTVVEPAASGLGGGFFAIYYDAKSKQTFTIDAREEAPRKIDQKSFLDKDDKPIRFFPERQSSSISVGIPGTADGLALLLGKFGSLELQNIFAPAIEISEKGFEVSEHMAKRLLYDSELSCERVGAPRLAMYKASRELFMKPLSESSDPVLKCGKDAKSFYAWQPLQTGDIITNKDFAKTLRLLSDEGLRSFYTGKIAETIVKTLKDKYSDTENSDIKIPYETKKSNIDLNDLDNYRAVLRDPLRFKYRDHNENLYEIVSMGPPSSGGVALAEMLNIIDDPNTEIKEFDLSSFGPYQNDDVFSYRGLFLESEVSKIAFADRNRYLADEDFIEDVHEIKKVLIDTKYADRLRNQYLTYGQHDLSDKTIEPESFIDNEEKMPSPLDFISNYQAQNNCYASKENVEHGTTHISISDKYGNVISATASVEWFFGNGMVVPGYGFVLNNQLTDFEPELNKCNSIEAGQRQRFSAHGKTSTGEKAKVSLGSKRPRSSMTPVMVFKDEKPFIALGAAGGSTIISSVMQVLINILEHDMNLAKAIDAPRFYNLNSNKLLLEEELYNDKSLIKFLQETNTIKTLGYKKDNDLSKLSDGNQASQEQGFELLNKSMTSVNGILIDQENKTADAYADKRREGFAISF